VTPHTIARQWKGKSCVIEVDPTGASLWRDPAEGFPSFQIVDPFAELCPSVNGSIVIFTDERFIPDAKAHFWRFMREGVKDGIETRPDHLPGRFHVTKALGLAVHLGASRVTLKGTEHLTAPAFRNLEKMVRPLKGHRVRVIEPDGITGLFPCE